MRKSAITTIFGGLGIALASAGAFAAAFAIDTTPEPALVSRYGVTTESRPQARDPARVPTTVEDRGSDRTTTSRAPTPTSVDDG